MTARGLCWWLVPSCVVAFLIAGLTYIATALTWIGPAPPTFAIDQDLDAYLDAYLTFRRETMAAEQIANVAVVVGSLLLGVLLVIAPRIGALRNDLAGRVGGLLAFTGSVVYAATQLAYLGAIAEVLTTSTIPDFDARNLGTWTQVIDRTDDYVENLGLVLLAVALLLLRTPSNDRHTVRWRAAALILSAGLIILVAASFARAEPLTDVMLALSSIVLVPVCAIILGARIRMAEGHPLRVDQ